jgi:HAD superfamily hydrolase (TIGR01459 family)
LSNTSRLGADVIAQLVGFGIPRHAFVDVVSSGDVTRRALVELRVELSETLAKAPEAVRALHLGSSSYVPWLWELGFSVIEDEAEGGTDLVVATGMVSGDSELRSLATRLRPLAEQRVPLVCTNPDKWIPSSRGLSRGPGVVAQTYRDLGGPTLMYGKPYAPIYRAALARIGCAPERIVAIGDMVETDIVGAASASLASVLVTTGVHAAELGPSPDDDALHAVLAPFGVKPMAILARFGQR